MKSIGQDNNEDKRLDSPVKRQDMTWKEEEFSMGRAKFVCVGIRHLLMSPLVIGLVVEKIQQLCDNNFGLISYWEMEDRILVPLDLSEKLQLIHNLALLKIESPE